MASNDFVRACQSARSSGEASPVPGVRAWIERSATRRSASRYGSGRSSRASQTLTTAAVTPIPSARIRTAVVVNQGCRRNVRTANRASCQRPSSIGARVTNTESPVKGPITLYSGRATPGARQHESRGGSDRSWPTINRCPPLGRPRVRPGADGSSPRPRWSCRSAWARPTAGACSSSRS